LHTAKNYFWAACTTASVGLVYPTTAFTFFLNSLNGLLRARIPIAAMVPPKSSSLMLHTILSSCFALEAPV
ncbi:hypothetical protein, partial [Ellagibacter isourolithinifaciens]|uniref:hypothetical protein n=1 Tax=Ellagibacter isourolithinifaciens TaxID=2137581 RepID=UPI003A919558